GMTYASGCASGTLSHWAEGNSRSLIVIIGFIIGGFIGIIIKTPMISQDNWMGKGPILSFWDTMGLIGGLFFNMFLIVIVYLIIVFLENKWGDKDAIDAQQNFVQHQNDLYLENKPTFIKNEKLSRTYYNLFTRNWTLITGALMVTVIGVAIYTATGGWGISTAYAMWGTYLYAGFGGSVDSM
ncbi:MAG: YeeE/YedE family protein, partial [Mycoplasmataceae bacterium]|nr:YeeE/YedE family protein [Mycoplasmataceae bacterium]